MVINNTSQSLSWSSFGITNTGKERKHNEDAMLNKPEIGLWAVADGMGGHSAGDIASQMVVKSLNGILAGSSLDKYVDDIEEEIINVNVRLREKAKQLQDKMVIGSTVVGMIAYERFCTFFWVGDSRLYRLRNGSLRQLSVDHSQVETYIEQGIITREEAIKHPQGNVITRAVGANQNIYVDFDIQEMRATDRYMLCSDGLTKHLRDTEFQDILGMGNAETACKKLIGLTLERGATDNVTAVVIDIT